MPQLFNMIISTAVSKYFKKNKNHREKKRIARISLEIFYQWVRLFLFTKVTHKAA